MKGNGALSPSMLVPLQLLAPGYYGGGDSSVDRQLAVVAPPPTATSAPRFQLPDGWKVKEVARSDASRVDKYYYEPGTGRKFDSLKAVERHVTGGECKPPRKKLKLNNRVRSSGAQKVRPQSSGAQKYYYEPGTGRKFRSRTSVEKHLAEMGDDVPLSQVFDMGSHVKNSASQKKISKQKVKSSTFDSSKPPEKINWVLADPGGRNWNPYMGESMVPEPTKQQWANRFMLCINDKLCCTKNLNDEDNIHD